LNPALCTGREKIEKKIN